MTIALPLLAVLASCWSTLVGLHGLWTDWAVSTYTHGYLVLGVSAWLLWWSRNQQVAPIGMPLHWRLLPLCVTALMWLFAAQAGLQVVEVALLPALLWAAVLAGAGWQRAWRAAFPLAYLYFAVPVWGSINGIFLSTTVVAVRAVLGGLGVPAIFDANHVQTAGGAFEIAGGCSGLHFVIVGLSMAALVGELRGDNWFGRIKLALLALALAVVANWIRVASIVMIGNYTHMQHYLVARSHYGYGWLLFAVAMVLFFVLERRMAVASPAPRPASDISQPAAGLAPGSDLRGLVAVLLILAMVSGWRWLATRPATIAASPEFPQSGWRVMADARSDWMPMMVGADQQLRESYENAEGRILEKYVAVYLSQRQGKELGGYGNDPVNSGQILGSRKITIGDATYNVHGVVQNGQESLVAVAYQVDGRAFSSATQAQLWYAIRSLLKLRSVASQVRVIRAACLPDCTMAETLIREFEG